ncbi:MAG: DUF4157 domain-containing protein [Chloroflexi bacterium]|jgi:hypothetical protein|nr:DUF4157 domain-containing protein [Chloroflexota bacterium]
MRVIGDIRRDGGKPSVDSIATELSSMHSIQRAPALLALQQTHGNRYVQRVVSGIQAKLKVGQPGDVYEQEADRVADAVMRMPEPGVQRQPEKENEEEKKLLQTTPFARQITPLVQRQVEEEEEKNLQTKGTSGHLSKVHPDLESRIQALRGGGQPLPESVRAFFEPRFGYDFSQVRLHTDTQAAESAQALNARAFTAGGNIVFGSGQYEPKTATGRKLLSHELTHVVQQESAGLPAKVIQLEGPRVMAGATGGPEGSLFFEFLSGLTLYFRTAGARWTLFELISAAEYATVLSTASAVCSVAVAILSIPVGLYQIGRANDFGFRIADFQGYILAMADLSSGNNPNSRRFISTLAPSATWESRGRDAAIRYVRHLGQIEGSAMLLRLRNEYPNPQARVDAMWQNVVNSVGALASSLTPRF